MDYTIAETKNIQTGESVNINASGKWYYLIYEYGDGEYVISGKMGREAFDLFYQIGQYVTQSLYSFDYKASKVRDAGKR